MMERVAVELSFDNAAPLADIRSMLTQIKQGFVNVDAPKPPVLSYPEVAASVFASNGWPQRSIKSI